MNNDIKDFEINSLEYEETFKLDKRNYFQYYIYLLKNNHPDDKIYKDRGKFDLLFQIP